MAYSPQKDLVAPGRWRPGSHNKNMRLKAIVMRDPKQYQEALNLLPSVNDAGLREFIKKAEPMEGPEQVPCSSRGPVCCRWQSTVYARTG